MHERIRFDRRQLLAAAALLPVVAHAQPQGAPTEGRDFRPVKPAQPVEGGRIEVLEFFQYSCPHCYALNGVLEPWTKSLPSDVDYKRLPINWDNSTLNHTKIYYTLEQLKRLDLHDRVFAAYHNNKRRLLDPKEITEFMAANGIDAGTWNSNFNSFSVNTRVTRAGQIWRAYKIDGTPMVAVDGKYLTAPSMVGSREGTVPVLEFLIARARSERGRK